MSDLFNRVTEESDIFKKILSKVPGFSGYFERQNRRAADQLVRQTVAARFEEQWKRLSSLQRDLISQGEIQYVDDLEGAAVKIRQFIDRIKTASYGYAGLFDSIKINQEELAKIYEYDLALLNSVDELAKAVDLVETSIGSEGLPAAIRNVTGVAQQAVEAFNRRSEVILGSQESSQ
ncbi:MAG: hypothetical protein WHV66_06680 [Anaerolineales bacterium]